jgi:hypothetical protein
MQRNVMQCTVTHWNGIEWNGTEWNVLFCYVPLCSVMFCCGLYVRKYVYMQCVKMYLCEYAICKYKCLSRTFPIYIKGVYIYIITYIHIFVFKCACIISTCLHMLAFAFAHLLWWFQFLHKPENRVPIQFLQLAIMQSCTDSPP